VRHDIHLADCELLFSYACFDIDVSGEETAHVQIFDSVFRLFSLFFTNTTTFFLLISFHHQ
jgi:hypothetical protein